MNTPRSTPRPRWAFYVKCRPRGVDAAPIALKHKRVFIGYPPWRKGYAWDRHHVSRSLLNLGIEDALWDPGELDPGLKSSHRGQITMNRKFAREIEKGDVVLLPRPGEGICYLGRVSGSYELVDDPAWGQEFLDLRVKQDSKDDPPDEEDISEIVQCWEVEEWHRCPFPFVPRWISYRLLARNTVGWLDDQPTKGLKASDVLEQIIDGTYKVTIFEETSDLAELERRIVAWVAPASFEQLMCELLQLEHSEERWFHVGGAGDGGSDGIAVNDKAQVTAVLQCKWMSNDDPYDLGESLRQQLRDKWGAVPHVYVAMLFNEPVKKAPVQGITFLDSKKITELLARHSSECPAAASLGWRR